MEDRVTPPLEKTPEQIQAEMAGTRDSLTEKVAALETQVVGTVQTAADTLTGTVESVKSLITTAPGAVTDTVKQAAEVVSDKVKELFDISGHVRNRPWTSVGVSAGLGFLTGLLVFRHHGQHAAAGVPPVPMPPVYAPPAAPAAPAAPGILDGFVSMIGAKAREVAENFIHTASASLNQTVSDGVPKLVDAAKDMAVERLTPGTDDPTPVGSRRGYGG